MRALSSLCDEMQSSHKGMLEFLGRPVETLHLGEVSCKLNALATFLDPWFLLEITKVALCL